MFWRRKKKELPEYFVKTGEGEEPVELEKGDLLAIFLAAFLVILPIILIVTVVMLGTYWLFIGRFF